MHIDNLEFFTNADRDLSLGFGGLDSKTRKRKDLPIERDLFVSLEEVYFGAIKKFSITKRVSETFLYHAYFTFVSFVDFER